MGAAVRYEFSHPSQGYPASDTNPNKAAQARAPQLPSFARCWHFFGVDVPLHHLGGFARPAVRCHNDRCAAPRYYQCSSGGDLEGLPSVGFGGLSLVVEPLQDGSVSGLMSSKAQSCCNLRIGGSALERLGCCLAVVGIIRLVLFLLLVRCLWVLGVLALLLLCQKDVLDPQDRLRVQQWAKVHLNNEQHTTPHSSFRTLPLDLPSQSLNGV